MRLGCCCCRDGEVILHGWLLCMCIYIMMIIIDGLLSRSCIMYNEICMIYICTTIIIIFS